MENVMNDMDVLIVGAGAAGLTLALELARRRVAFRLVEKMDGPFHGSRGKGLQPRTLEVFEDLGVLDRIAALGGPYPVLRTYAGDGSVTDDAVVQAQAATPAEPYGTPLMLPQFLTEAVLRARLLELGHRVEFGVALDGFTQDADGVTAHLVGGAGPATVRARWLVGTDGGRSTVRRLLGVDFPGKTLGVRALVADVELTGLDRTAWHRFNEGSMARQAAICPLAGTDLFQIQAPVPLEGDVDLSAAALQALVGARSGRDDIHVRRVAWASAYSMNARLAARYRVGRVFLAGDAAHIHPPTGGQGLNTSVQDAYNLAWKLAGASDALCAGEHGVAGRLLDSYEEERRPIAEDILGLSTRLLDAAKRGDLTRGRDVKQLDLAYPASPLNLAADAVAASRVCAGGRAPDAPVRGAGGQAMRLFDLFKGTHWTLLAVDADAHVLERLARPNLHIHRIGAGGDVVDADGHVDAAYGLAPGGMALVRPDGYLAAVTGVAQAQALAAHLGAVMGA
jgi:2-polyprenyl-6-methoxyphenol hydroxylase-like FAD-dependent oxidoreductase